MTMLYHVEMKYLGIDFGLKRVGLAFSEGTLATPFKTLEVINFKDATVQVLNIIKEEGFEKVVVGLPEGKMGQTVLRFIKALKKSGLKVAEADETLSTHQATLQMIEAGIKRDKRQTNDAVAAAIILQNYLDLLP